MKNCVLCSVTSVMIESVWKNLTGLQKGLDKSIGTPSLQENKALPNCANKENNVLKNCISTSVARILKCMK